MSLANLKGGPERLAWLRAADDSYRGLVRVLLEQKKPEEALERWEWYQGRPMLQGLNVVSHAQSGKAPTNSQKKGSNTGTPASAGARLVYASFKDGLQVWVSSSKGVGGTWVDWKQKDFERTVREFAEHCADPDSSLHDIQEQGAWLYAKLLEPVITNLPESEAVTVELDRLVYNLPMEALRSPSGWYSRRKISHSLFSGHSRRRESPAGGTNQPTDPHLDSGRVARSQVGISAGY